MIWEIVVYSPPPAVPSRSYIIVQTRDSSSTPWFIRRPNPVFLKDIPVRRFFQRLFKSDNVMFYTSYSFDFVKSILWPKYNYLITLTGVLYKLNFALKVSSNFLFQKKWNFSTLVAFQVRLLSRETTGTVYLPPKHPESELTWTWTYPGTSHSRGPRRRTALWSTT